MGFECVLSFIPIINTSFTPAQTLAMYLYAEYEHQLEDDWHQTQIANGYTFEFDACDHAAMQYLTCDDHVLDAYLRRFQQANGRDPGLIDFWCSIGRRFHSSILEYATPVFPEKTRSDDYYYLTKENLVKLHQYWCKWLEDHPILPVAKLDAYYYDSSDKKTVFTADGAYVFLNNDALGHVEFDVDAEDSSPLLYDTSGDPLYRGAIERLAAALQRAIDLADSNLIIYCGGD